MNYNNLHDDVLEETILGEMIYDPAIAKNGVDFLDEEDFFVGNYPNRALFKAMLDVAKRNEVIDYNAIITQLKLNKDFEKCGGLAFLSSLLDTFTSALHFEEHCKQLKDLTLLRKLVEKCDEIITNANQKPVENISSFLTVAENKINEVTAKRRVSNFEKASDVASRVGGQLQSSTGEDKITGLRTGYLKLDTMINGLGKGQVILVAARPGVGKSQLALNICFNVAKDYPDKSIAYFSLEMSNDEIMKRLFAIASRTPQGKINTGFLTKQDKSALYEAQKVISETQMYFEESASITIDEIALKCHKLKDDKKNLGLVVIDHVGIIKEGNHRFNGDQEKISYYARTIKVLALELNCPIILVAHINRKADETESRKPELSQLRGSGELENSCDKALLLYRSKYYKNQGINVKTKNSFGNNQEEEIEDNRPQNDNIGEKMTITVAKNRQGAQGRVDLLFFPSFGTFDNPDDEFMNNEGNF